MSFTFTFPKYRYFKNKNGTHYYKYDAWTQPILTSNTSSNLMQIQVSSVINTTDNYDGWRSFESNQEDSKCWCADPSDTSAFMIIKFSEPLYLRSIDVKNRTTTFSFLQDYILQGSNDSGATWDTIYSGTCSNFEASGEWNLFKSNGQNPKYAWLKIVAVSNYGEGYTCIGNIFIDVNLAGSTTYTIASPNSYDFTETYIYGEEVSPSDEYDYIEVSPQSYNFIKEVTKYYKNVTRYYKYIEQSWVQPILTENGTFGVSNLAVRASSERDIRMAYKAFDGSNLDSEVDCWHTDGGAKSGWLSWYSKNPIKILSLTIYNRPMWNNDATTVNSIKDWELQVSNDGITWRTIKNGTNGDNVAQSGWGIAVDSTVQVFSNYWRLNILSGNGNNICVGEIKIRAIAKNSYEVSSTDDYDYAETTLEQVSPDKDYDSIETFGRTFKALWKNPLSYSLMIKADNVLTSTFIKVNGKEVRTDAYGYITLNGFYGEDTSFYIQYGNWSKAVTIRFGEKISQVTLSPDFEILTIKYPSGALVANKTVQIGGVNYITNSNGQVTLYGSHTSSKSLYFYLDGNNYVTKTVIYQGTNTTITLEAHVIAGSISASVWNFNSSSYGKKALTFTAPTYVKVIKLTGSGFDGWSDEAADPAYVGTSSSSESAGGTVVFSGTGSFTKYVGVTPGKTYTLYGRWIKDGTLAYSDDINKQSVNVNLG